MLAFTVNDTKSFMSLLLKSNTFDDFLFRQGEIVTFSTFYIEGKRNPDFYSAEEQEQGLSTYVHWAEIRPFVFQAVKGQKLPTSMKIVLALPEETLSRFPNTKAAFLNLTFREKKLHCTAAIAQESFSLDKTGETLWGEYLLTFLQKHNIGIELS